MGKRRKSEAWSYFVEVGDTAYAECISCKEIIRRGKDGERSSWSVTPLWAHLKRHHPELHTIADNAAKRVKLEDEKKKDGSTSMSTGHLR